MTDFISSLIIAAGVTLVLLLIMLNTPLKKALSDHPNVRSLHERPVPRIGGLAMMLGIASAWLVVSPHDAIVLAIIAPLIAISLLDDFNGLSPVWRLIVQVAVAGLALSVQGVQPWAIYAGTLLMLVWSANLFNFMDGSDGLAGGMAVFGFGAYALAAAFAGHAELAVQTSSIAAAALVFLMFNFFPARVFMGDAGSIPLGFLACLLGVTGIQHGLWPIWFPFLVFSPFMVDATITLVKRGWRGEKVWQAHREHYYQRLILLGHGHRKTALLEYALMIAAGLSALWGAWQSAMTQALLLGAWALLYLVLARAIDRRWRETQT